MLYDSSTTYLFQEHSGFTPPTPAFMDSANNFEMTDVATDINWTSVPVTFSGSAAVLVTVKFKCRLYNNNAPHNELVLTDGTFKGMFKHN